MGLQMIESLEARELLSAVPHAAVHHGQPARHAVNVTLHHVTRAKGKAAPSSMIGLFGGPYTIYPSDGGVDFTVTSVHGNSFVGNAQFQGNDGGNFAATFKGSFTRNYDFKITIKGKGTSLVGTGTYYPSGNINMQLLFSKGGKIDGQKMNKYVYGVAGLIYGTDAFNYFG